MVHFFALLFWVAGGLAFVAGMPQLGIAVFVVIVLNGLFAFAAAAHPTRCCAARPPAPSAHGVQLCLPSVSQRRGLRVIAVAALSGLAAGPRARLAGTADDCRNRCLTLPGRWLGSEDRSSAEAAAALSGVRRARIRSRWSPRSPRHGTSDRPEVGCTGNGRVLTGSRPPADRRAWGGAGSRRDGRGPGDPRGEVAHRRRRQPVGTSSR